MRALLVAVLCGALGSSGCAVSSSLVLPSCVDKVEISGEHQRVGSSPGKGRLVFDHSFDPPFSKTDVILKRGDHEETVTIWNNQPDGGRLLVGIVAGIFGGVLWASALYDVAAQGANPAEEGPFYAAVFGTGALSLGALLSLTGWHPGTPTDINDFCREPLK